MSQYNVALSLNINTELSDKEVGALVTMMLQLGATKAGELVRVAENATNPDSLAYDPKALAASPDLLAIADSGFAVQAVNNYVSPYAPNTLVIIGTNADGKVVIQGSRSSEDANKDFFIMDSALELSQAVELRNVDFDEHKIGGLLVRPATRGARHQVMRKALASLAAVGDVYTDAYEAEGFVKAAENLGVLALELAAEDETMEQGMLHCNGACVEIVDVRADGSFEVKGVKFTPDDKWTVFVKSHNAEYPVTMYDCEQDIFGVLTDAKQFYNNCLTQAKTH
ncbi:hypothetical protein [Novimethylophilus kurashikiensis]|nr:hypothetical protein [Novimethylophilus kurashikiensis]